MEAVARGNPAKWQHRHDIIPVGLAADIATQKQILPSPEAHHSALEIPYNDDKPSTLSRANTNTRINSFIYAHLLISSID